MNGHPSIEELPPISAWLHQDGSRPRQGRLREIRGLQLAVDFSALPDERGQPGEVGQLALEVCGERRRFGDVAIWDRRATAQGARLGIEILTWPERVHRLPQDLQSLFNRRGAYRVRPHERDSVRVGLLARGLPSAGLPATLYDLSGSGLGVDVDDVMAEFIELLPDRFQARFTLPSTRAALTATVRRVHSREMDRGGARLGLAFRGDDRHFEAVQRRVQAYVVRRQREDLQAQLVR